MSVVCDDDVTMMCDEQARLTRDDFACTIHRSSVCTNYVRLVRFFGAFVDARSFVDFVHA